MRLSHKFNKNMFTECIGDTDKNKQGYNDLTKVGIIIVIPYLVTTPGFQILNLIMIRLY